MKMHKSVDRDAQKAAQIITGLGKNGRLKLREFVAEM
jgi:hypothetical protein